MASEETNAIASRLCAACGMCCNGVIFSSMRLQPVDSARKLSILGLRAKNRKDGLHLPQPCPAHNGSHCTIYADRPERCRVFECRQLKEIANGTTDESSAMEKIARARQQVEVVRMLLERAGEHRINKPLAARFAAVFTPPLETGAAAAEARNLLSSAMSDLTDTLARDFHSDAADAPRLR